MNPHSPSLDSAFVKRVLASKLRGYEGPDQKFMRAIIDSREAKPNDLFVALSGARTDGHDHAAQAVESGASGCILKHTVDGTETASCFYVDDPLSALQMLAASWRAALPQLEVIGVTGNVGKTTTKLIVAHLLKSKYQVQVNPLNYNNEISVPLCLLELSPATERAVIEHGMYAKGEIELLCSWTRPQIGIVLNIGPVHLERAGSIEAIALAKRELIEALPANGYAILNIDDPLVAKIGADITAKVITFGTTERAQIRGHSVESHGVDGFSFTLAVDSSLSEKIDGAERRLRVPLPGTHLLSNVLAGIATAVTEQVPLDAIGMTVEQLAVPLRLKISTIGNDITLLDDTYNASPASMHAALDLLAEMPGRHLALLGDMLELGSEEARAHQQIGERVADDLDFLFTIGKLGGQIGDAAVRTGLEAFHIENQADAARALITKLRPGDALLVKASNQLHLDDVVKELTTAMNSQFERDARRKS